MLSLTEYHAASIGSAAAAEWRNYLQMAALLMLAAILIELSIC